MKTVGFIEEVVFKDFTKNPVRAKIDTGAYSGAMHAEDIKIIQKDDGQYVLSFRPFGLKKPVEKKCFRSIEVRSSDGLNQQRFSILTKITISGNDYTMRISLTDRSNMSYEVIIGRRFLKNKFLVDPK
ncbi:MAG: RimK/LysX family protein [Candidatus Saccharibacteria bacterium]|nr:RimK/LysX family protein [Candidatus Saccharibacteria bacterium]